MQKKLGNNKGWNGVNNVSRYTVEPLIAATFTAKVMWPLLGGGRYSEVYMGKHLGLKVSGRYREVAAIRR